MNIPPAVSAANDPKKAATKLIITSHLAYLLEFGEKISSLTKVFSERDEFDGAPEGIRTPKIRLLRPTRIPVPSPGQIQNSFLLFV